jgi:hypothetical protein
MTAGTVGGEDSALKRCCGWLLFCFLIFALKFSLLALDPSPKFFLGDSASYIWTAVSGWIPADRSFTYGYIIHWLCSHGRSLTPLLLCQAILGGLTAIIVAIICRSAFSLSTRFSYFFGLVSAFDPLQLLWERYVMTEVMSLFLYALILLVSFSYLRERRLWQLVAIQILGVALISLRISYLLLIQAESVLLPLIAYFPELKELFRRGFSTLRPPFVHLAVSIVLLLLLHSGYKRLNGRLSNREPAYVYVTGFNLLAMWAPALTPGDSPDPRLAELISKGDEFAIKDAGARGIQLYRKGYLVDRWKRAETSLGTADVIAKQTALNALRRDPLAVTSLGWNTFLGYWHFDRMRRQAQYELGNVHLPESLRSQLIRFFNFAPPPEKIAARFRSSLQKYFLNSQPYYNIVVLAPLFCLGLLLWFPRPSVFLLFFHSAILLGTSVLFTVTATVRYLQPLSLLMILLVAAACQRLRARRALAAPVATASSNR